MPAAAVANANTMRKEASKKQGQIERSEKQAQMMAQVEEIVNGRAKTTESILLDQPIPILDYSKMVVGKELGAGSFSCAYEIKRIHASSGGSTLGKPLVDQPQYIMKKLSRKVLAHPLLFAACAADLLQEGRILALLRNHSNVIQLRGWSGPNMIDEYFVHKSREKCFLVMDRLDQTMETKLLKWKESKPSVWTTLPSKRKQLELELKQEKMGHILNFARALEHLHKHFVLHRDLKPANIGFDAAGTLKVYDFDLSRVLPSYSKDEAFQLTAKVGSPRYMAPEVTAGESYNLKADVFSFGLLVYQMLTGKTPWKGLDYDWSTANKHVPKTWSTTLRLLMEQCQSPNHKERPTMSQCVSELQVAAATKEDPAATVESTGTFDLGGLCGMELPAYEDFEELLGCATGVPDDEEERTLYEQNEQSSR